MRPAVVGVAALVLVACATTVAPPSELGPVVLADHPPPAVHGGGLLLLADGRTLVVSDADRDRVIVVDLVTGEPQATHALPTDSWPGQAVESSPGWVHVVLRGAGSVFTFRATDDTAVSTDPVCAMPSSIALDASQLVVACGEGDLVWLDAGAGHAVTRRLLVADDLRDVIMHDQRLFVTTFRAAAVMEIDRTTGAVLWSATPPDLRYAGEPFRAGVAWRTIALPGRLVMLHQRSRVSSIRLVPEAPVDAGVEEPLPSPYDQRAFDGGIGPSRPGDDCSAIVRTELTMFDLTTSPPSLVLGTGSIAGASLAVDVAAFLTRDRGLDVAIANAGVGAGTGGVRAISATVDRGLGGNGVCAPSVDDARVPEARAAVAVAFDTAGQPIVLEREPAGLLYQGERIDLGGASAFDTGHALFHSVTPARIACASCHPEGREDGQVWIFDGDARRTQSLAGGLLATAPFHWDGLESSMGDIVSDVFVRRMGGTSLDAEHVAALGSWLDQVPAPHGITAFVDLDAAARGRQIFEGDGGCAVCHAGTHFTDDVGHSVGTGTFQTPSLIGVSHRLPLMRSGCATTLLDRFDPACGGAAHGTVFGHPTGAADVAAYLATL